MVTESGAGGDAESRAGLVFGDYELIRLLGRGGFGEVYEARDVTMDRVVALKLIRDPFSKDPVFRERLFREARSAGQLREPHIVSIHRYGEVDGQLYIDMRLVDGGDLKTLLAALGPLEPARAVGIVEQIASALDAAHAAGMVHRDVKPANILLGGNDFACLVDFGLVSAAHDTKLTTAGATIGTFAYLAPERLTAAGEASPSADIYALACVLHECLTGTAPFEDATDIPALIAAHIVDPIPQPSEHNAALAGFDDVIETGMAKEPQDRYQHAGELAAAARAALTATPHASGVASRTISRTISAASRRPPTPTRPAPTRPAARTGRRRRVIIASATALVAAIVVAAGITATPHQPTNPTTYTHQTELRYPGFQAPNGIAIDTAYNLYLAFPDKRVWRLTAGTPTQLYFPALSTPLGIAVDSAGDVYVTDTTGATGPGRVLMLTVGADTPRELPFPGLVSPTAVAVDLSGTVYVCDSHTNRVEKLPANTNTPQLVPFAGLDRPQALAVGNDGSLYVANTSRVLKLSQNASAPTELPFAGLTSIGGLAVDAAGDVYLTDSGTNRVLKLAHDAATPTELPFTGLKSPHGVAVDPAGNVYVADTDSKRVLKLPTH